MTVLMHGGGTGLVMERGRWSFVMAPSELGFPPPIEVTLSLLYKPD